MPLIKVLDNDSPVLVASMGGMPMHPSWYFNVIANPRISVQIGSEKKYYLAKKLTDEEKDRVWPTVCSFYPDYDQYKKNTQRNIGVFSCEEKTMTKEWKKWVNENIILWWHSDEIIKVREKFNEMCITFQSKKLDNWLSFFKEQISFIADKKS